MTVSTSETIIGVSTSQQRVLFLGDIVGVFQYPIAGSGCLALISLLPSELLSVHGHTLLMFLGFVVAGGSGLIASSRAADAGFAPVSRERKAVIARDPLRGTFGAVTIALSLLVLLSCAGATPTGALVTLTPVMAAGYGMSASTLINSVHPWMSRIVGSSGILSLAIGGWLIPGGSALIAVSAPLVAVLVTHWCRQFLAEDRLVVPRTAGFAAMITQFVLLAR